MTVFVDLQGFKTEDNKFIPKEVAFLYCGQIKVFLFKAPCRYIQLSEMEQKQVYWIERNRKIFWNSGDVPYEDVKKKFIFLKDKHIYVKGCEKVRWVKEILESDSVKVFNLETYGCPNRLDLENKYWSNDIYSCINHSNVCALKNVLLFKKWSDDSKCIKLQLY